MISLTLLSTALAVSLWFAPVCQIPPAAYHVIGSFLPSPPFQNILVSKPGRFSIALPDGYPKPQLENSNVPSEIGQIKLSMYTSVREDQGVCLVGYSDISSMTITPELKEDMLNGAKEGALAQLNATLEAEEGIMLDGHPGRSIRFTSNNDEITLRGRMDYYMVGKRLYQIGFIEISDGALDSEGINNYFSSFKLTSATQQKKKKK